MVRQPDRPLGPDFDNVRGWLAAHERQLTDWQRWYYNKLKYRQDQKRFEQQQKLHSARRELEDARKKEQARPELALRLPGKSSDNTINHLARSVLAAQNALANLDRKHADERVKQLKQFEQQREQNQKAHQKLES